MPGSTEAVISVAAESTGRKRKRGGKPAKDPNAPKRATTAFFFFAQEERARVRAAHPEFKVTEISKELGKMWKDLQPDQKAKFEGLAIQDKERYQNVGGPITF